MGNKDILKIIRKAKKDNNTVLDLSENQLTKIPKEIANLINLQYLNLSSNKLTEIPKEITNLTNLQSLRFHDNKLTEVPKEITNLINLQYLNLSGNKLTEIPKEITNLTNLKTLRIYDNKLTKIPKEIVNLINLQSIDLNSNELTEIPKEITNLTNLKYIYLNANKLTKIPKEITNLTNLKYLDLTSNQLTEIPKEITNLTNLLYLYLNDNQLKLPSEITKNNDAKKILSYLKIEKKDIINKLQKELDSKEPELVTLLHEIFSKSGNIKESRMSVELLNQIYNNFDRNENYNGIAIIKPLIQIYGMEGDFTMGDKFNIKEIKGKNITLKNTGNANQTSNDSFKENIEESNIIEYIEELKNEIEKLKQTDNPNAYMIDSKLSYLWKIISEQNVTPSLTLENTEKSLKILKQAKETLNIPVIGKIISLLCTN